MFKKPFLQRNTRQKMAGLVWSTVPDNDLLTAGAEERVCGAAAPQPARRGMKPKQRAL